MLDLTVPTSSSNLKFGGMKAFGDPCFGDDQSLDSKPTLDSIPSSVDEEIENLSGDSLMTKPHLEDRSIDRHSRSIDEID